MLGYLAEILKTIDSKLRNIKCVVAFGAVESHPIRKI